MLGVTFLSLAVDTGAKTWSVYLTLSDTGSETLGLHGMYINVWGSETEGGPWTGPLDITSRLRKLPKGATETDEMDVGFYNLQVSGVKVGTGYKQFGTLQSNTYEEDSEHYTNILLGVGEAAGSHPIGAADYIDYTNPVLVAQGSYTGVLGWINVSAVNPDTGVVDVTLLPASLPVLGSTLNTFHTFSPAASDVHGASFYIVGPPFDFTPATAITFNVLKNAVSPSQTVTVTNNGTGPGVATFAVDDPAFTTPAATGLVDVGSTGTSTLSMAAGTTSSYQTITGKTLSVSTAGTIAPTITIGANVGNATADMTNSASAFGTPLTGAVAWAESYANLESRVNGTVGSGGSAPLGSTATILAGINEGLITPTSPAIVSMAWRTRTTTETTLIGDVVNLTGMDDGSGQTDIVVFQMTYAPALLPGDENTMISAGQIYLASLDLGTSLWTNAVDGNSGGTPAFAGDSRYSDWFGLNGMNLGDYGVDTSGTEHAVWAVVDHNSQFGAGIVPEPATLALLSLGGLGLVLGRKRK